MIKILQINFVINNKVKIFLKKKYLSWKKTKKVES